MSEGASDIRLESIAAFKINEMKKQALEAEIWNEPMDRINGVEFNIISKSFQ